MKKNVTTKTINLTFVASNMVNMLTGKATLSELLQKP